MDKELTTRLEGLAILTIDRRQKFGNISTLECIEMTIGHYPDPSKSKILLARNEDPQELKNAKSCAFAGTGLCMRKGKGHPKNQDVLSDQA